MSRCVVEARAHERPTWRPVDPPVFAPKQGAANSGFGCLQLCGTAGKVQLTSGDTFFAFKTQLEAFIGYLRTGVLPFPFAETVELMQLVIAGIRSREQGGREVALAEI